MMAIMLRGNTNQRDQQIEILRYDSSPVLQNTQHKQNRNFFLDLFVCLFGFLTSLSTTRLYCGQVSRLMSDNFTCCHTRDRAGRP